MTVDSLAQQKHGVRAKVKVLRRSPSTIIRALPRNVQPKGYASITVRTCAQRRRRQGCPLIIKLHRDGICATC
ncbi:MAG: hypothetical protein ACTS8S_04330 [Giesbergeria sp.]